MVHNGNPAPSYDTKLNLDHPLKRRIFVAKKPSYGSQMCQVIGKVTKLVIRHEGAALHSGCHLSYHHLGHGNVSPGQLSVFEGGAGVM